MGRNRRSLGFESLEPRTLLAANAIAEAAASVGVSIPTNLSGRPGTEVVAPVNVTSASGIRGAEIHLKYDTALLDANSASVEAGSVWPGQNTEVVASVDDAAGSIVVAIFAPEALGASAGSLLKIHFTLKASAPPGTSTRLDLTQATFNEGAIAASPQPQIGDDPTDGAIAIRGSSGAGSISGTAYADTNRNGRPDAGEGLPGVQVSLVDTASGQSRQVATDDSGHYEFRELPAGSYEVRESQPAAILDGGANQRSLTLAEGQSRADQDFRELGLRPGYVSSRLFTTTALPVGSVGWTGALRRILTSGQAIAAGEATLAATMAVAVSPESEPAADAEVAMASPRLPASADPAAIAPAPEGQPNLAGQSETAALASAEAAAASVPELEPLDLHATLAALASGSYPVQKQQPAAKLGGDTNENSVGQESPLKLTGEDVRKPDPGQDNIIEEPASASSPVIAEAEGAEQGREEQEEIAYDSQSSRLEAIDQFFQASQPSLLDS